MQNGSIELIARGVLIGPHGILLCHAIGQDNTFLPGGHVEYGEPAATALVREMLEELQVKVEVDGYLGTVENVYTQDGEMHHEVNLIFEVSSPPLVRRARVVSAEPKLSFEWHGVNTLAEVHLLPRPLRTIIPQWTRGKHEPWASEMRQPANDERPRIKDESGQNVNRKA